MRTFLILMRREASDARAITIALAVIAPLAMLAYEEFLAHYSYGHITARTAVPGAVALFAAILASDLVSAEVATRRINALAALPVGLAKVWQSKVAFLVLATVSFAGWTYGTTAAMYATRANPELTWAFFGNTNDALLHSLAALPLAFSVLFFSTLLPRGFAAALAGGITIGAVTAGLASIDYGFHEIGSSVAALIVTGTPTLLGLLMLVGSYLAFTRGPIHSGGALRKTALALTVPLAILVPGTTAALAAARAYVALEPGDADADIHALVPSPDQRFLALGVRKHGQKRQRAWVLDMTDGSVIEAPGERFRHRPWQPDGSLLVWAGWEDGANPLARWIDPDTGDIRKTRSYDQITTLRNLRKPGPARPDVEPSAPDPQPNPDYPGLTQWWTAYNRQYDRNTETWTTTITWDGRTESISAAGGASLSPIPGCVVFGGDGGLVHRDLATGEDLVTITGKGFMSGRLTHDGRYVHVYERDEHLFHYRVAGADTGKTVAGPWTLDTSNGDSGAACHFIPGNVSSWVWVRSESDESYLLHLETKARVPCESGNISSMIGHERKDGDVLIARDGRIDVIARDGELVRSFLR